MTSCFRQKTEARLHYAQLRHRARHSCDASRWGPLHKRLFLEWWSSVCPQFDGLICSYFPIKDELSILPSRGEGRWYFPRVTGANLHWFSWSEGDPVPEKGAYGIPSASSGLPARALITKPTLFFTPALAVRSDGFRLGYGGGYYDRLFADPEIRARSILVVAIPECCTRGSFPVEKHDVRCDVIVTESCVSAITPTRQLLSKLVTTGI